MNNDDDPLFCRTAIVNVKTQILHLRFLPEAKPTGLVEVLAQLEEWRRRMRRAWENLGHLATTGI